MAHLSMRVAVRLAMHLIGGLDDMPKLTQPRPGHIMGKQQPASNVLNDVPVRRLLMRRVPTGTTRSWNWQT